MAQIKLSSSIVNSACHRALSDMESKILKTREDLIDYEMNRKWFRSKTREDAILALKHSSDWAWYKAEWPYSDAITHIKKLIKACALSGDINLDQEDVHVIRNYI